MTVSSWVCFLSASALVAASSRGLTIGTGLVIWIVAGTIVAIFLIPYFYRKALHRKGGEKNLRQFLMQDEKTREALREHYEKGKSSSGQSKES